MESPRFKNITFQPIRHSFPVRFLRATYVGQNLFNGLSKIWNRKARRLAAALTAIILGLVSGVWAAQAVAICIIFIVFIWTGIELDRGGCSCR